MEGVGHLEPGLRTNARGIDEDVVVHLKSLEPIEGGLEVGDQLRIAQAKGQNEALRFHQSRNRKLPFRIAEYRRLGMMRPCRIGLNEID
jgi:hypothetical protein